MTVTVVYDNSEATELCAAQHLYLKPIAKLMINVLLPESIEPVRPFSNWEVLDQLKSLICPDQFTTVRLSKSTKDFIRFEGEAETRSLVQILKAKLHGKIIKINGLKTDLKVVATDAQGEWEHFPKEKAALVSDGADEQEHDKSPDSIYFEGLPCKWFAPKGSSGEKPCEEILRVVFESFGKIKNVDIPMLDPYREVMTGGSFGGFSFGLQTFEAFIQYQESTDFIKAMESLRGMKLMLKGDDGKALACNIKVMFDTTKHFSEGAIKRRNQERLKLQELEEERKKEKKREEEVAERKRKEEVRKAQEKRKKARDRRRALKERDRHRSRKEKVKAKAEAPQELDSSEEWEERKYLLAQRRVEALRLLRVLLRKISVWMRSERTEPCQTQASFAMNYLGSTQFNSQEVDVIDPEAYHISGTTLKTLEEEELNTLHLPNQEEMERSQVSKSDSKQKQKMKKRRAHLQKSSHYSTRKERTEKLFTDGYNRNLVYNQNSVQITMTRGQSLEKDDDHSSNKSYRLRGRKKKIYETDEFINYLLNFYQTPKCALVFLEASDMISNSQWQRNVYAKGNGFQINLRKQTCHSTTPSEVEDLESKEQDEEDYWPKVYTQVFEYKSQKRGRRNHTKECTKKLKSDCKAIASEAGGQMSPADGEKHLLKMTHIHQVKKSTKEQSTRNSQIFLPLESVDFNTQLNNCLEEISSDSECFNETLSVYKDEEERFMAEYHSSTSKGTLDNEGIITCKQKTKSTQETLHSEWKHESEERYSNPKLKIPDKRSKYELTCSKLEDESKSIKNENISKSKEKITPRFLYNEDYHYESNSSEELEDITRKRRVNDSTVVQKVKGKSFHMPLMSPNSANAFYLSSFPKRRQKLWKSEYNQNDRRFTGSRDFLLDSDNYNVRHNSQEHIEYGGYLRSNYSSLYFEGFGDHMDQEHPDLQ
nr:A-kinase anchor protein 17B-like isoform X2 [Jaculus jaculus]XP_044996903.1 A-kinase anchor protein 17B-like isoform X2 [Jaculus jaculus]